jgi:hypothetical protein
VSGWTTLYDVSLEPFRWGNAGEGLVALAILSLGVAAALALRHHHVVLGIAAGAVALIATGVYVERTVRHRRDHDRCVEAVVRREGRVVEGVIRDHRPAPAPWQGAGYASFVVAGETVSYPVLAEGCGFHESAVEVGAPPLRDGARVRLRLWQGQIVQLEIRR